MKIHDTGVPVPLATPRLKEPHGSPSTQMESMAKRCRRSAPIFIGSDCSGVNAAKVAFESLGIDVRELFASEKDEATRATLIHNFGLRDSQVYRDCQHRHTPPPRVDFYSAGVPCQCYSGEGLRGGLTSETGRVGLSVISYIAEKKPKYFVLENVRALISSRHWGDFELIMNFLRSIKGKDEKPIYRLTWKVVDALHCGVPQSRPRLFIVGLSKERASRRFLWPTQQPLPTLDQFLDEHVEGQIPQMPSTRTEQRNYLACVRTILRNGHKLNAPYIADLATNFGNSSDGNAHVMYQRSPCLTRGHAGANSFYYFSRGRKLTLREYFRLQGFPDNRIEAPPGVSERQLRCMVGNSICVPAIAAIIDRALYSTGLTASPIHFTPGSGEAGNQWPHRPARRPAAALGSASTRRT